MAQGDWAGLTNTTIAQYLPGVTYSNIFRKRATWMMLRQMGKIFMDGSGTLQDWKVEYKLAPLRPLGANTNLTYAPLNRYFTAQLEWRGYAATDSMSFFDQAKNKGKEAIINVLGEKAEKLSRDATLHLADELYVDGT